MEPIKCPSCGVVNPPGEVACRECGTSLVTPYSTPTVPANETVVVRRTSDSSTGVIAAILGIVAVVVVGFVMYQWGRTSQNDDDVARERDSRSRSTSTERSSTSSTPAPAPPVTTTTAPPVVTVPAAPVTITTPPPVTTGSGSSSVAPKADAGCSRYMAQIDPLVQEWQTAQTSAETSTGADRATAIEKLRDIERRAARVTAPQCAAKAQGHLVTAMTAMIDALRAAPSDSIVSTTDSEAYQRATELMDDFQTDYTSLRTM